MHALLDDQLLKRCERRMLAVRAKEPGTTATARTSEKQTGSLQRGQFLLHCSQSQVTHSGEFAHIALARRVEEEQSNDLGPNLRE